MNKPQTAETLLRRGLKLSHLRLLAALAALAETGQITLAAQAVALPPAASLTKFARWHLRAADHPQTP